jgi:hypothetical protein
MSWVNDKSAEGGLQMGIMIATQTAGNHRLAVNDCRACAQ